MAQPSKGQPEGLDKQKMKQILVPALAIAAIVILVALVVYVSDSVGAPKMPSDGSNGGIDDADLKAVTDGVKFRDLKVGTGEECPRGADVKVHYVGWLPDGTEFDNSRKRNEPAKFSLNGVVAGWSEGIPGMKVGGVRKLVIAPEKGYGKQVKGTIPANSTLIFEVELLEVIPPPPKPKLSDGTDPNAPDDKLKDIGDGLKVRDIKEGSGEPVKEGAEVTIHYTGWLQNGNVFDNSRPRGEPNTFALPDLVKGWQKGIPGMKPGGIRKLVVPPELGYGGRPKGDIPPNSTLIFEVELIK